MTSLSAFSVSAAQEAGTLAHSRSALALAIAGHVIGAIIMVQLLEAQRPVTPPPLIVEILQPEPEVRKVLPPPPLIKPPEPRLEEPPPPPQKLPEPKVEIPPPPPPPDVLPEPLPQVDIPPPPRAQPVQPTSREPIPEPPQPVVQPAITPPPEVRRPVQPVQAPPPPVAVPRNVVREVPVPPVLTAKAPSPVEMAVEQPRLDRLIAAPEAPRVAPRQPPRRPLPDAAPAMDVAAAPMPESDVEIAEPEPAPLPIGPVPEEPEINLDAAGLTALYLRNPKPGYPAASRRLAEQGTVYVRAFINAAGEPKSVELKKSSGYPRLDRAALDAIKGWKFVPARRNDKPVDAAVIVPMKFTLSR